MSPAASAMRGGKRRLAALLSIGLLLGGAVVAAENGAQLQGRLIGMDGRGASGYCIRLTGPDGAIAESRADDAGRYRFAALPPGLHGLAISDPAGTESPVELRSLRLDAGTRTRADFKLLDASTRERVRPDGRGLSARSWWGDLTTPAKIWTAVVIVSAGVLVAAGLDSSEQPATPF